MIYVDQPLAPMIKLQRNEPSTISQYGQPLSIMINHMIGAHQPLAAIIINH